MWVFNLLGDTEDQAGFGGRCPHCPVIALLNPEKLESKVWGSLTAFQLPSQAPLLSDALPSSESPIQDKNPGQELCLLRITAASGWGFSSEV